MPVVRRSSCSYYGFDLSLEHFLAADFTDDRAEFGAFERFSSAHRFLQMTDDPLAQVSRPVRRQVVSQSEAAGCPQVLQADAAAHDPPMAGGNRLGR